MGKLQVRIYTVKIEFGQIGTEFFNRYSIPSGIFDSECGEKISEHAPYFRICLSGPFALMHFARPTYTGLFLLSLCLPPTVLRYAVKLPG